jgi:small subunit ribosomal protein S20
MSSLKTLTKKVYDSKEKANAEVNLKEAISFIDKTVSKGRIHKNTAARRKSALTRFVNKLEADK